MNVQINQLVKSLLQKDTLEQCSLRELQEFADRHPYFGAAQLLLTKKLKQENAAQYNEQLQKTFLFFHNPLWVEKLLEDTGTAEVIPPPEPVAEEVTEVKSAEPPLVLPEEIPPPEEKEPEPIVLNDFPLVEEVKIDITKTEEPVLPLVSLEATKEEKKDDLLFEPFHTVDYFASQGIKFKEEEKPVDKFGQQLKSFTAWLKTMKRLPVSELSKTVETGSEEKVEKMAAHSLQDREVVTETMAEVWEKQGNKAKAIEVYSKLSLLEPSKSPYFAAKIEDLKKTN